MISSYQVDGIEDFMLEFHEANQSTVLTNGINLGTSMYLRFKKGFETLIIRNVKMTRQVFMNTRRNPCVEKNEQNRESQMSKEISLKIGCNLQWAKFKIPGFKNCSTKQEMEAYYKYAQNIDEEMDEYLPNCKQKEWKTFEYFTDLNHEVSEISKFDVSLAAFENTVSLKRFNLFPKNEILSIFRFKNLRKSNFTV